MIKDKIADYIKEEFVKSGFITVHQWRNFIDYLNIKMEKERDDVYKEAQAEIEKLEDKISVRERAIGILEEMNKHAKSKHEKFIEKLKEKVYKPFISYVELLEVIDELSKEFQSQQTKQDVHPICIQDVKERQDANNQTASLDKTDTQEKTHGLLKETNLKSPVSNSNKPAVKGCGKRYRENSGERHYCGEYCQICDEISLCEDCSKNEVKNE